MKLKVLSKALEKLPNGISAKVGRSGLVAQKHSPALLFGVGIVSIVTTVVLASRATLKVDEVLEKAQQDLEKARTLESPKYSEVDRQKDIALVHSKAAMSIVKLYGPAVIVGVVGVCALTGSHVILTKRNVALTAAYAAIEKSFNQYRKRIVDEFGVEKDRHLHYGTVDKEIVEETEEGPVVKTIKRVDPNGFSAYAKWFDESNPNWTNRSEYNSMFLRGKQNYANDRLRSHGHVFLNEVYDSLGIERTKAGAVVGWIISKDGDNYVDFGLFDGNSPSARDFVNGYENSIRLDFNVNGVIYDKI